MGVLGDPREDAKSCVRKMRNMVGAVERKNETIRCNGSTTMMYATLDQSRGNGGLCGRLLADRNGILEMILVNITRVVSPDRLQLLDTAVLQLTKDDNGYSALENGLKLCHCTAVPQLEGGSLAPMTFTPEDGRRLPRRQVPLLWLTSSVRRAIEHVMFSHYSAMHVHGVHIVIVGPGAANNFHAKVINSHLPRNGSSTGCDYFTTENLPFSAGRPWNFGVDTMVLEVAGPNTPTPWAVRVVDDSLLGGEEAVRALARSNDFYFSLPVGCGGCGYDRLGCVRCITNRGVAGRLEAISTPYLLSTHLAYTLLDQRVCKLVDGEWCSGTIDSYARGLYTVIYDGDLVEDDHLGSDGVLMMKARMKKAKVTAT